MNFEAIALNIGDMADVGVVHDLGLVHFLGFVQNISDVSITIGHSGGFSMSNSTTIDWDNIFSLSTLKHKQKILLPRE